MMSSTWLRVALLEPYYGGSHKAWVDGYIDHSQHRITPMTMPAQAWKWRMQGGAISLARQFESLTPRPDVVLASDMMDLSLFRAVTRHTTHNIPHALYFHENQLTYPQNSRQHHGWRYGFINYASAMSADALYFNSQFHLDAFFEALPRMLKHFYDYNELETVPLLRERADVLPLGLDLARYDAHQVVQSADEPPLIVWNHRWEEDKNPHLFLSALRTLAGEGVPFRVALLGENVRHSAEDFEAARVDLGARVVAFGYLPSFADYARLLWEADYVVSTAHQEFFGGAVAEALYCGCVPILPKRLNYPALVPPALHDACLYLTDDDLLRLLRRHLRGEIVVRGNALRGHIRQHDWTHMAPVYDAALTSLAALPKSCQG